MMASCEKCWADAHGDPYKSVVEEYRRLVKSRTCTPEQQAGPHASTCPKCRRDTLHQHCGLCMACGIDQGICRQCGGQVPRARWCYATPTCYTCLPPPPPIQTATLEEMGGGKRPKGDAEAFSALLKADGPQDTIEPDAEPSAGDRHEFASLDEMVAGLGRAGGKTP